MVALAFQRVDVGAIVLLITAGYWQSLVDDMKRLHREPTVAEILRDSTKSTYRSIPTERAFRFAGCYLPATVLLLCALYVALGNEQQAAVTFGVGLPVFFGVVTLAWRARFQELRFHQAQIARDRLADLFFENSPSYEDPESSDDDDDDRIGLPGIKFFLYLRPFTTTDGLKTIVSDSLTAGRIDLEVRLADALAIWGPLIALGRPGEVRGAGRAAVSEDEWRTAIDRALDSAEMIFVLPGFQHGIVWEMRLIVQKLAIERVVFVRPPMTEHFNKNWWANTRQAMHDLGLASPEIASTHGMFFTLDHKLKLHKYTAFSEFSGQKRLRKALKPLMR